MSLSPSDRLWASQRALDRACGGDCAACLGHRTCIDGELELEAAGDTGAVSYVCLYAGRR